MSFLRLITSPLIRNNNANRLKCLALIPVRQLSDEKESEKKELRTAHPVEHAVGLEKFLLLCEERGIDDPFFTKPQVRGPGTKDEPNLVPTFEDKRFIACLCEEDQTHMKYMWVHLAEPKRCYCGYWFKAVPARKFWEEIDFSMGQ